MGVLLPNVSGAPVTLLALWSLGKVPALLNYSTGAATMLACAQLAGLKQIITSRAFVERAKLNLAPLVDAGTELIHLEDVHERISGALAIVPDPRDRIASAESAGHSRDRLGHLAFHSPRGERHNLWPDVPDPR